MSPRVANNSTELRERFHIQFPSYMKEQSVGDLKQYLTEIEIIVGWLLKDCLLYDSRCSSRCKLYLDTIKRTPTKTSAIFF